MENKLWPALTLGEIYGEDLIFSPRASPNARTWLPSDEGVLDMVTGGQFATLGAMPILCAAAVSTPEALQLLQDAGFDAPAEVYRYNDASGYLLKLSDLISRGKRIIVQHVHPVSDLAPDDCWIPPSTLSFLNNKRNLGELVGAPQLPTRRVVALDRIAGEFSRSKFPLVLKAVTDESTGGGSDVVICGTAAELWSAAEYFRACTHVVVEDVIDMRRNLCLNYAVSSGGSITYLGSAEQVIDSQIKYHGNWIDSGSEASTAAVALGAKVARLGSARGYWGCMGVDMAILHDGRVVIYDLNFRINGSTAPLLLAASVRRSLGQPIIRFRSWKGKGTYRDMLNAAYAALGKGILLPLSSYDPEASGYPRGEPRLSGLLLGATRDEVRERERELADLGLGT